MRFRPLTATATAAVVAPRGGPRLVKLPLRQRRQLIQAKYGCSVHEARVIMGRLAHGVGADEEIDPWGGALLDEGSGGGGKEISPQH